MRTRRTRGHWKMTRPVHMTLHRQQKPEFLTKVIFTPNFKPKRLGAHTENDTILKNA